MPVCVGCGRDFRTEQSLGLHLWQARRTGGAHCSEKPVRLSFDDENARIVVALNSP